LPDSGSKSFTPEPALPLTRLPLDRTYGGAFNLQGSRQPKLHGIGKAQTFHHSIPFVAHKRLTVVSPPVHTVRVRPSVIQAEIDRINHKVRPSLAYQPVEDYFNSRSVVTFDDETKSIRAQTAALLKRIHEPLPRATKSFPISATRYQELPIPERITSDAYIHRLLGPTHNVKHEIDTFSHYDEPAKRLMGKGHLACVSFAGGRAFPRRKNLFSDDDRVKNDVQFLSHYKKNKDAAGNPQQASTGVDWYSNAAAYSPPARSKPISRFYRPTYISDENLMNYESPTSSVKKSSNRSQSQPTIESPSSTARAQRQTSLKEDELEDSEDRISRRRKKRQEEERLVEEKALEEQLELEKKREEARQAELARQEKLAQEAALERQMELERKAEIARQEELERQEAERKAEAERQAELERQEAERKAEAERQAELERQEAERKAEAERLAELERQEAELKAEAELAELERQEAELKAEADRLAELERQEELARLEAETNKTDVTSVFENTPEFIAEQETAPEVEGTEKPEAAPETEEEVKATEDVTSPGVAEETGPEPVVEEPLSPDAQEISTTDKIIEEVQDAAIPEEVEQEQE